MSARASFHLFALGTGAGLLAGACAGFAEASLTFAVAHGRTGAYVLFYGTAFYALATASLGGAWMLALARVARSRDERVLWTWTFAPGLALHALVLSVVQTRHVVFDDGVALASGTGACVIVLSIAVAVITLTLAARLAGWVMLRWGTQTLSPWPAPTLCALGVGVLGLATLDAPTALARSGSATLASLDRGNVLFVVVDTLRADHLGSYGYDGGTSPNLDAFARDAIRFDRAFANASWTRPSFASLVTGRYASSHGVMHTNDVLPEALPTLAETLRADGYATAGIVTNANVSPYFAFDQGFDEYTLLEPDLGLGADFASSRLALVNAVREARWAALGPWPGTASRDAADVNRAIDEWMTRRPVAPWLLFVGYVDPHDPYDAHPYRGPGEGSRELGGVDARDAPRLRALYDDEIRFWDDQFGRLLARLRREGLYDELTIVVTADHGEEFGDHGDLWHGTTLYDEQLHVPLFVHLPHGRRGGEIVEHCVQSIDVMPTLLAQLGVRVPAGVQGGDLFEGSELLFAEEDHRGNVLRAIRRCAATEEITLIEANEGNPRGLAPLELYRPSSDGAEQDERSTHEPDSLREMRAALERMSSVARGAIAAPRTPVTIDPETTRALRALGYVPDGHE